MFKTLMHTYGFYGTLNAKSSADNLTKKIRWSVEIKLTIQATI